TVCYVERGAINTEVRLDLGHGLTLTAVVTNESYKVLGLAMGARACALIKASHIIIGVD
ncbi:MAG: TOBE domain-containing protein, partial [Proteobacteria bacterium]|nr:TOBE domain-containing protein [Pseudomonadota bacterium]